MHPDCSDLMIGSKKSSTCLLGQLYVLIGESAGAVELAFQRGYHGGYEDGGRESAKRIEKLKNQTIELNQKNDALLAAISRGGSDISPCRVCGEPVVCLPEGLCLCDACSAKEEDEQ